MRLLLVSLGTLNGAVLEAVAKTGAFDEIVVASRNAVHGTAKVNTTRVTAAIHGRFPAIRFERFDFNASGAGEQLKRMAPGIVVTAPSLLPWWAVDRLKDGRARAAPFATFLACHVAPMLAFRRAWDAAGLGACWVNASYPDVVNAVLARTGAAPECGVGNVEECVPKARIAAAEAVGASPEEITVRMVAPHALEYHLYAPEESKTKPPCLVHATWRGRDVSKEAMAGLYRPMPILYDMDFNLLTAAAAAKLLPALAADVPTLVHVPGPHGRVGGYPVQAAKGRVTLDLAPEWSEAEAIAMNERALHWDGVAGIEGDGTVVFTDATAAAIQTLLGRPVPKMKPRDAAKLASELLAVVR
jgi:hypothetical protein